MSQIIYLGTVMSVCDEYNGNRVRVRITLDGSREPDDGWPYAFPLLPKTMQTMPKEGEMVFVMLGEPSKRNSPRYYIGPIISQPQKMYKDEAGILDTPASLLPNSLSSPMESTSHFSSTFGSFPRVQDVGIVGRKSEDIILKDNEINIRCGVRNEADGSDNKDLVGDVIFNSSNPAYIQLKHQRQGTSTDNLINLVGGCINLMSNKDAEGITKYMKNLNNVNTCKKEILREAEKKWYKNIENGEDSFEDAYQTLNKAFFDEPDYEAMMVNLHKLPYGDVLVKVLEIIRNAILHHKHRWAEEEPTTENVPTMTALQTWGQGTDSNQVPELSDILLSNTVRIS